MTDFVKSLHAANPACIQPLVDHQLDAFKALIVSANASGKTSISILKSAVTESIKVFSFEQRFLIEPFTTVGCGSNYVDERDPEGRCCVACDKRITIHHYCVKWHKDDLAKVERDGPVVMSMN